MAVKRAEKNSLNTATNGGVTVEIPTEEEMTPGVPPVEEPEETPTVPAAEPQPETVPEEEPAPEPEKTAEEPEEPVPASAPQPEPEEPPAETEKTDLMARLLSNKPETASGVQVDTSVLTPDPENIPPEPEKNVRIRLREDHKCVIAMKRYVFQKGKCYDVPPNVKRVLNKRGLLSPL